MKELNVFKFYAGSWKSPKNWIRNIRRFFRSFKYAYQRATRGYSDMDLWDLDYFYLTLFYTSLKDFRLHFTGYPGDMKDEHEWEDYLQKMEEYFYNADEMNAEKIHFSDDIVKDTMARDKYCQEQLEAGMKMLTERFFGLWD